MKNHLKKVIVLVLTLLVSGAVWADGPGSKISGKKPKSHHNIHKPGIASNTKPGGHKQTNS